MALSPSQSKEGDRENLGLNIPEAVSVHRWTRDIGSSTEGRKDKRAKQKF